MNNAMYAISYGLYLVTTNVGTTLNGCITNTVVQVATDKISVAVNKANYTCELIQQSRKFTASIISEAASFSLFKHFGFQSGREVNKFNGYDEFSFCETGPIITEGTNAWISAEVTETLDLGSHMLFIATVKDKGMLSEVPSATYNFYQENIKPKKSTSDVPAGVTEDGKTIWRCKICGYEYVGEELPDDFICPICKHPAEDFEKV